MAYLYDRHRRLRDRGIMYLRIHKTDGYLLSAGRQRRIIGTYQAPCRPWSGQVSLEPRSMVDVVNVTLPQAVVPTATLCGLQGSRQALSTRHLGQARLRGL